MLPNLRQCGALDPSALDFLNNRDAPAGGKPKAYLNWVLLDEQMKIAKDAGGNIMASGYSGSDPVGDDLEFKLHAFANMPVKKNGYLYIYVSNETPNIDVFFDNLQVTHTRGAILEETHYYPFGLTMAGISSKALRVNYHENKRKFNNGTELNTNFDINLYETNFRSLDPQIGRFWQVDPMADVVYEHSPYAYAYANNNPLTFNDPLGLLSDSANPIVLETVTVGKKTVPKAFQNYINFSNGRQGSIASDDDWPVARYSDKTNLLKAWIKGKGAENRIYLPNHRMTKRLKNANAVNIARAKFYKKYISDYKNGLSLQNANLLNEQLLFGTDGIVMAGFDIVEQFVGGMTIDIHVDESGENLLFVVKNTTGKHSAFYHAAEDIERVDGQTTPMGNMNQVYIWSEPIGPGVKNYERNEQARNRSMINSAPGFN